MKKYMNTYNETLEAAGMLSPRKAAAILAALPEEMQMKIGVIKPREQGAVRTGKSPLETEIKGHGRDNDVK